MHPDLFTVFGFKVGTFGLIIAVGLMFSVWLAGRRAPRHGVKPESLYDVLIWALIPGILGARIVYVAQHWEDFSGHPDELWTFQFAGLTSFGGIGFALIGIWVWSWRAKIPLSSMFDIIGLPLLILGAIGRVACLMNGCCYGRPTDAWYGVFQGSYVYQFTPAQIFDSAMLLVGAGVLSMLERRKLVPGQSFVAAVVAYGVSRYIYEFWRAGTDDEVARGLATSAYAWSDVMTRAQVAAGVMIVGGLAAFFWFGSRRQAVVAEPSQQEE
ncbi:MAG: prolipoprotein diacylglyceryl transferase [Armatimonadetes bacterium]|nr:prolipoprotein diacylglyceryl transferase [Armatimonadota bacterium]